MAVATVVEKYKGTPFVSSHVYGAWWFVLLWGLLLVCGVVWIARRKMRRWPLLLIHGGLAVVLAGAFVTHLTRWQGTASIRCGTETGEVTVTDGRGAGGTLTLPFTVRLNDFSVKTHEGSDDASDYISRITISDGNGSVDRDITMNHTVSAHGVTIMQSAYDRDGLGSVLTFSSDPVGTPLTYAGYALLFAGVISMLFYRGATFRRLLDSPLLKNVSFAALLLVSAVPHAVAANAHEALPPVLPQEEAAAVGRLMMLHNGRVCPLQTYALDFTRKLCGSSSYRGLSAEQVVTGWMFWPDEWAKQPMIKTGRHLQATLMLPPHASFNQFFNAGMGGYILGPYIREYYGGANDKFHADVAAVDERLQLVIDLRREASLKLFPLQAKGAAVRWYAPADDLPQGTDRGHALFVQNAVALMRSCAVSDNYAYLGELVGKVAVLQSRGGGQSLPTHVQVAAERAYNAVPVNTILFMVNLTMGFVLLIAGLARVGRVPGRRGVAVVVSASHRPVDCRLLQLCLRCCGRRLVRLLPWAVMCLSFLSLTAFVVLRWIVSGTVPMANGFETMLFVAWAVMLLSLLCAVRLRMALTFGFIMSGFFLLVSHISQMDPQITHVMPVLNSPLLSIHVSIIMFAFAMLSITFICSLTALLMRLRVRLAGRGARGAAHSDDGTAQAGMPRLMEAYAVVSRLFLYPAITFLTIGIFVGAIWAERSWGIYWGWDPKETWALITLMLYAVPLHTATVGALRRPMTYHVYMTLAFLSIVMTYFGVNYFLGGMHSYA